MKTRLLATAPWAHKSEKRMTFMKTPWNEENKTGPTKPAQSRTGGL
jgi:hypothetical protein